MIDLDLGQLVGQDPHRIDHHLAKQVLLGGQGQQGDLHQAVVEGVMQEDQLMLMESLQYHKIWMMIEKM